MIFSREKPVRWVTASVTYKIRGPGSSTEASVTIMPSDISDANARWASPSSSSKSLTPVPCSLPTAASLFHSLSAGPAARVDRRCDQVGWTCRRR